MHISSISSCELSDEGRYLVIYISRGAEPRNKLLYSDLNQLEGGKVSGPLPITKLVDNFDADWDVSFVVTAFIFYLSKDESYVHMLLPIYSCVILCVLSLHTPSLV